MEETKEYLKKIQGEVESYLEQCINNKLQPFKIIDAVKYSLLGGGKRVRAILAITIGRILGGKDENIFPYAAALEFIHAYSLVHDDLPAMDDDDYRRGKLSTHKKYGESIGILAGDALATHAFWVIGAKTEDKEVVAPLVETLAYLSGLGGMVSGQVADILAEKDYSVDEILGEGNSFKELLDFIHIHKTSALIAASCKGGAIAAKASQENIDKFELYGKKIGLAFQIMDDILDVTSTQEKLGKAVKKDQNLGKLTYPGIWGLEKSREKAKILVDESCELVSNIPNNKQLINLANFIVKRDH